MALPKVVKYDAEYVEPVVTTGKDGMDVTWIGIGVNNRVIHIVYNEGAVNDADSGLEATTGKGQVTLEDAEVVAFYQANSAAIDALTNAAFNEE